MKRKGGFLIMKTIKRLVLFTFVFFAFLVIGEIVNPVIKSEAAIYVSVNKSRIYNDVHYNTHKYTKDASGNYPGGNYVHVLASDIQIKESSDTYGPMGLSDIVANGFYNNIKVVGSSDLSEAAFNVCTGKSVTLTGYNNLTDNEKIGEGYIKYGEIVSIYFLSEYMGKGYGYYLLNACIEELKKSGFHKIILWVLEENQRARKFYENNGFICTDNVLDDNIGGKDLKEIMYMLN